MENKNISEAMANRINSRNSEAANEAIKGMPQRSPSAILEEISSRLGALTPPVTEPKPSGFTKSMKKIMKDIQKEAAQERRARRSEEPEVEAIKGLTYK